MYIKIFTNIYSFVQDHYWNVGFLRYFTCSKSLILVYYTNKYLICPTSP